MAIMKNHDGTELMVDCHCGCDDGVRIRLDKDDFDYYWLMNYTNGHFYSEQNETFWRIFCKKMKKIWAIVRNKDYHYSDICMTKDEFEQFREYINSID